MKESKIKFLLASMKSLTNCEIPSSNPFSGACFGFLIAACVSKSCSETASDPENCYRKPAMNVHWKKSTNESKGKPEQKFDSPYGTIFIISQCFQRSNKKLHINFSLERTRQAKTLKTICACIESTDLIVQASKKNSTRDIIP